MKNARISSPYRQAVITIPKSPGMPAEGIEKKRRQGPWFDIVQFGSILLKIRSSFETPLSLSIMTSFTLTLVIDEF